MRTFGSEEFLPPPLSLLLGTHILHVLRAISELDTQYKLAEQYQVLRWQARINIPLTLLSGCRSI